MLFALAPHGSMQERTASVSTAATIALTNMPTPIGTG
jgi:hypothetical protein